MFTTAVQAGPNGSRDLPIPFPRFQCVLSNSPRPVYEAALRPHETLARPTGLASGSHGQRGQARFALRTYALRGPGLPIEAPTFPSRDYSRKPMSYETRSRRRLRVERTSSRSHSQAGTKASAHKTRRTFHSTRNSWL